MNRSSGWSLAPILNLKGRMNKSYPVTLKKLILLSTMVTVVAVQCTLLLMCAVVFGQLLDKQPAEVTKTVCHSSNLVFVVINDAK